MTIVIMMISQDGSVILLQPKLASGFTQHPNSVIDWFVVLKKNIWLRTLIRYASSKLSCQIDHLFTVEICKKKNGKPWSTLKNLAEICVLIHAKVLPSSVQSILKTESHCTNGPGSPLYICIGSFATNLNHQKNILNVCSE